jgi:hypothetical protein
MADIHLLPSAADADPAVLAEYPTLAARLQRAREAVTDAQAELDQAAAAAAEIAACRARAKAAEDEVVAWKLRAESAEGQLAGALAKVEALEAGVVLVRQDGAQKLARAMAEATGRRGRADDKEERRAREAAEAKAASEKLIAHEREFGLPHL